MFAIIKTSFEENSLSTNIDSKPFRKGSGSVV